MMETIANYSLIEKRSKRLVQMSIHINLGQPCKIISTFSSLNNSVQCWLQILASTILKDVK